MINNGKAQAVLNASGGQQPLYQSKEDGNSGKIRFLCGYIVENLGFGNVIIGKYP